jgi:hypothetical protein
MPAGAARSETVNDPYVLALVEEASRPVFIDRTGRRRRVNAVIGVLVGTVAIVFGLAVSTLMWSPGPSSPVVPSTGTGHPAASPPAPIR